MWECDGLMSVDLQYCHNLKAVCFKDTIVNCKDMSKDIQKCFGGQAQLSKVYMTESKETRSFEFEPACKESWTRATIYN